MNNVCMICKATIDLQWSELQNEVRYKLNIGKFGYNHKNNAFIERCIYCYKNFVELNEKREREWYKSVMDSLKRSGVLI